MLEELQALDVGQLETAQIETRPLRFAEGDIVALKHNRKHYLEPFFLAIRELKHQAIVQRRRRPEVNFCSGRRSGVVKSSRLCFART